jgi:hypothetical protein
MKNCFVTLVRKLHDVHNLTQTRYIVACGAGFFTVANSVKAIKLRLLIQSTVMPGAMFYVRPVLKNDAIIKISLVHFVLVVMRLF